MTALRACLAASAATLALVSTAAIVVSVTTPTPRYDDATLRAHIAASDKLASVHHEVLSHSYCNENNLKKYDCYKLLEFVDAAVHSIVDEKDVAPDTYALTETTNVVTKSEKSFGGRVLAENGDAPVVELMSIIYGYTQSTEPLFVTLEEASSENIGTCHFIEVKLDNTYVEVFAGNSFMMAHNTKCRCPGSSSLDDSGIAICDLPRRDRYRFYSGGQLNCGTVPQGTFTLDDDVFTCNPPACDGSLIMFWNDKCYGDPGMDRRCDPAYVWGWPFYSDYGTAIFDSGMYSCP